MNRRSITILIGATIAAVFAGTALIKSSDGSITIEARADGFHPSDAVVSVGDTVTFVPKAGKAIWPASDPHPVHTGEPAFDSMAPVEPGQSWSFVFDKPGTYGFHDHLDVSAYGRITVLAEGESAGGRLDSCSGDASRAGSYCFDMRLKEIVKEDGVSAAFAALAESYDSGNVASACHWSAHRIGEQAYEEQKLGRPLDMAKETYYCGFGFYHGYLEAMLRDDPDPENQREMVVAFCDEAQRQLGGEARDNCYHGTGSGYTENPPERRVWGNPELVVAPGLQICERLFGDTREWEMCTTGVYAVPANFMSEDSYGFFLDPEDPFRFCASQDKRLHRACYGEFAAKLVKVTKGDLSKVVRYAERIDDRGIAKLVTTVGAAVTMQEAVLRDDNSSFIDACQSFPSDLRDQCIDGVVWGFLYHGRIGEEHVKAMAFCESDRFSGDGRELCYQRIVARAGNMYSTERFKAICSSLSERYRHYCDESLPVQLY